MQFIQILDDESEMLQEWLEQKLVAEFGVTCRLCNVGMRVCKLCYPARLKRCVKHRSGSVPPFIKF